MNLFVLAFTSLFRDVWWEEYVAAIAVPILGIALGSVIIMKDAATCASLITTAQRSITGAIIVTILNYTQPLANVSVAVVDTIGFVFLLILAIEWGMARARKKSTSGAVIAQPANEGAGG